MSEVSKHCNLAIPLPCKVDPSAALPVKFKRQAVLPASLRDFEELSGASPAAARASGKGLALGVWAQRQTLEVCFIICFICTSCTSSLLYLYGCRGIGDGWARAVPAQAKGCQALSEVQCKWGASTARQVACGQGLTSKSHQPISCLSCMFSRSPCQSCHCDDDALQTSYGWSCMSREDLLPHPLTYNEEQMPTPRGPVPPWAVALSEKRDKTATGATPPPVLPPVRVAPPGLPEEGKPYTCTHTYIYTRVYAIWRYCKSL